MSYKQPDKFAEYRVNNHNYGTLRDFFNDVGADAIDMRRYAEAAIALDALLHRDGDPKELTRLHRKLVKDYIECEKCSVSWIEERGGRRLIITQYDEPGEPLHEEDITSGFPSSVVGGALNERRVKVINDPTSVPYRTKEGEVLSQYKVNSQVTAPLPGESGESAVLTMNALNRTNGFDPTDVFIIYRTARQARTPLLKQARSFLRK